jgi:GDP-4-dehydro-6-deoxy-D-mannose reductase
VLGIPGDVYNLGRGRAIRIGDMVDELISLCDVAVEVRVDPTLVRSADSLRQEADTRKFTSLTGWQPRIAWHTTLSDTFEYWRAKVREEKLCAS